MTEFKVGDRVRRIAFDAPAAPIGYEAVVLEIADGGRFYYFDADADRVTSDPERWELVEDGPVRTVTRREIVPGMYGCVEVLSFDKDGVTITFGPSCPYLCAEELRSAAMIFSQLAEALEDQK